MLAGVVIDDDDGYLQIHLFFTKFDSNDGLVDAIWQVAIKPCLYI